MLLGKVQQRQTMSTHVEEKAEDEPKFSFENSTTEVILVKGTTWRVDKTEFTECWRTTWKTPYIMRLASSAGFGGLLFGYDTDMIYQTARHLLGGHGHNMVPYTHQNHTWTQHALNEKIEEVQMAAKDSFVTRVADSIDWKFPFSDILWDCDYIWKIYYGTTI